MNNAKEISVRARLDDGFPIVSMLYIVSFKPDFKSDPMIPIKVTVFLLLTLE